MEDLEKEKAKLEQEEMEILRRVGIYNRGSEMSDSLPSEVNAQVNDYASVPTQKRTDKLEYDPVPGFDD